MTTWVFFSMGKNLKNCDRERAHTHTYTHRMAIKKKRRRKRSSYEDPPQCQIERINTRNGSVMSG